jgi:hypothetical protein
MQAAKMPSTPGTQQEHQQQQGMPETAWTASNSSDESSSSDASNNSDASLKHQQG